MAHFENVDCFKVIWVEKDLQSCEAEINPHYYGVRSTKKWPHLCYKCGAMESLEAISSEDLEKYASIDPVCKQCIIEKNVPGPRRRRKKAKSTVHGTNTYGGEPSRNTAPFNTQIRPNTFSEDEYHRIRMNYC